MSASKSTLMPADRISSAEVYTLICFTINTLAFINIKLLGIPVKSHAVKKELSRCESYFEKIESIKAKLKGPSLALDQKATKRFIEAGLGIRANHQRFDGNGKLISSSSSSPNAANAQ
jgi:hypothetical protein